MSTNSASLTAELKREAARLGFDLSGVAPAVASPGLERFHEWLAAGRAGQMHYLENRRDAYAHPSGVLEGARSVVMLAINYRTEDPQRPTPGYGRVSRYAWGDDYHELIRKRLNQLADWLRERVPGALARGVVDTAPILEREFAQLAGLGWIGKNTLLLNKQMGSWFFLAALVTDLELEYDAATTTDHCGTCRACLDACPTDAFVDAWQLDARKCISYLTIELRELPPVELRHSIGDWAFGCDVCQDVCPWNHRAPLSCEPAFAPGAGNDPLDLLRMLMLSDEQFREWFRHSPLWRAKRRGVLRNAAIVLGNQLAQLEQEAAMFLPILLGLTGALRHDEPLVRGAAAWALGNIDHPVASRAVRNQMADEIDPQVLAEIAAAIGD